MQETLSTSPYELFVPNPERTFQLLYEFQAVGASEIAAIVDYDRTLTPLVLNSWNLPALCVPGWTETVGKYSDDYQNGQLSEEDFWLSSLNSLRASGLKKKITDYTNACLPVRAGIADFFQLCSQLAATIVYSAGVEEIIQAHLAKLAELYEIKPPTLIANQIDTTEIITSSSKNGRTLMNEFARRQINLQEIGLGEVSHFFVIGDSISDTLMCDGFALAQSVIKIGLVSSAKARQPKEMEGYLASFDIIFQDDDSLHGVNSVLQRILEPLSS